VICHEGRARHLRKTTGVRAITDGRHGGIREFLHTRSRHRGDIYARESRMAAQWSALSRSTKLICSPRVAYLPAPDAGPENREPVGRPGRGQPRSRRPDASNAWTGWPTCSPPGSIGGPSPAGSRQATPLIAPPARVPARREWIAARPWLGIRHIHRTHPVRRKSPKVRIMSPSSQFPGVRFT
jgi:hypothetical protein